MKVILASKNQHKLTELSAILSGLGFEIALESEYGLDIDVDETGTTFEENSLLKAEAVMKASGLPVLADDSGLMVDSLDGAPGVYSARYGHKNSDAERIDYLLHIVAVYGHAFEAERFKLFRKIQHRHDLITGSVDLKVIVIAEHYDVIQLIFVAYLSSFPDLAFLTLAVAYDDKHAVILTVKLCGKRHARAAGKALSERAGGDIYTRALFHVRMSLKY